MKKIEISKKTIKKIEKRLLKVVRGEYGHIDGNLYLVVERAEYSNIDGESPLYTIRVRFGRQEKNEFQRTVEFTLGDGNLNFIAGQFFQAVTYAEENGD